MFVWTGADLSDTLMDRMVSPEINKIAYLFELEAWIYILYRDIKMDVFCSCLQVLNEANLTNAILVRSVLTRSDLGGAVIEGADFSDAVIDLLQKQVILDTCC